MLDRFIEELEIFLTIIKRYKKSVFICDDFNINLLDALLCNEQFTELASLQLPHYLIKRMDQGGTPLNIYIDL